MIKINSPEKTPTREIIWSPPRLSPARLRPGRVGARRGCVRGSGGRGSPGTRRTVVGSNPPSRSVNLLESVNETRRQTNFPRGHKNKNQLTPPSVEARSSSSIHSASCDCNTATTCLNSTGMSTTCADSTARIARLNTIPANKTRRHSS